MDYVTLYQLRKELGIADDATQDDVLLRRLLRGGNKLVNDKGRRRYDALHKAKALDYPIRPRAPFGRYPLHTSRAAWMMSELQNVNDTAAGLLRVHDDLLEVLAITNGDGAALVPADWWYEPSDQWPKFALRMRPSSGKAWKPSSNGDNRQCIQVDGIWSYHTQYDRAWPDSLDSVQDNPLLANAIVITVSDADGEPEDSDEPRFQVGQQIRLGSATAFEYCEVRAVTLGAPDTLTVKRAINGTTAQQWPQNTPIAIWRPDEAVVRGLVRLATWLYRAKDVSFYERISLMGTAYKVAPGAIPSDVYDLLPGPRPMGLGSGNG